MSVFVDTRKPPKDPWLSDDRPPCKHCGELLSDHIADSDPPWMCRQEIQGIYGFFNGGDPRNFHPDAGDCTPEELENHRKACEYVEQCGEALPCPSGWVELPDGATAHVLRAPFGIGFTTFPPTHYEPDYGV